MRAYIFMRMCRFSRENARFQCVCMHTFKMHTEQYSHLDCLYDVPSTRSITWSEKGSNSGVWSDLAELDLNLECTNAMRTEKKVTQACHFPSKSTVRSLVLLIYRDFMQAYDSTVICRFEIICCGSELSAAYLSDTLSDFIVLRIFWPWLYAVSASSSARSWGKASARHSMHHDDQSLWVVTQSSWWSVSVNRYSIIVVISLFESLLNHRGNQSFWIVTQSSW